MSDSNKWKPKLLSSSVPMEYVVAKELVQQGFAVNTDYTYSRYDAGIEKDFSVDIHATGYPPFNTDRLLATVELLVECKHRQRGNKWLFFPDVNEPGMSPFTLGYTVRAVDCFSWMFLPKDSTVVFDEEAIFCMKGVEVDLSNGNVYDSEIKHGLLQLQYALPRLLTESVRHNIHNDRGENLPIFLCPILLTTAPILVTKSSVSIEAVEAAESLDDIAAPARWVVVHSDTTPDFDRHRIRECTPLATLADGPWLKEIDSFRLKHGEYEHMLPSRRCADLASRDVPRFFEYFSQTVICSLEHFPVLLDRIKQTTESAAKSQRRSTSEPGAQGP